MPISRRRKDVSNQRVKKRKASEPSYIEGNSRFIRASAIRELVDVPEFADYIRVGRLFNALGEAVELFGKPFDTKRPTDHRRFHRAQFLAAGYIYEGLLLVDNLWSKYHDEEFYSDFAQLPRLASDRRRKIVQTVRHLAFHLDEIGKTTKITLNKLEINNRVRLFSATENNLASFHFALADIIDRAYLIDELKKADQSEQDVLIEITESIGSLAVDFGFAAQKFLVGLEKKLKIV